MVIITAVIRQQPCQTSTFPDHVYAHANPKSALTQLHAVRSPPAVSGGHLQRQDLAVAMHLSCSLNAPDLYHCRLPDGPSDHLCRQLLLLLQGGLLMQLLVSQLMVC